MTTRFWVGLWIAAALCGYSRPTAGGEAWDVRDHVSLDKFVVQSHRGAGELAPENTVEAFELAWRLGTIPEADLRMTRDGVIVAFHDANFDRVVREVPAALRGKGVADVTWAELRQLDVGAWRGEQFAGRRILDIDEIFALLSGRPERRMYLDIKNVDLPRLAQEVKTAGIERQVILASTDYALIRHWKQLSPQSGTLHWLGDTEAALEKRLAELRKSHFAGITQLQIHVRTIRDANGEQTTPSASFLRTLGSELRSHGIVFQTLPWGRSDAAIYWKLMDLGVMSFATDYPDKTMDAIRAYYAKKK